MIKNDRTFRQDMSIVRRGLHEFDSILPKQLAWILARGIFNALLPFITTGVSAFLMNELLLRSNYRKLLLLCFLGVGLVFAVSMCKNYTDGKILVGFNRLFSSHELALTNKSYRMKYEELEKNSTIKLRDDVSGSINISGAGMASLYWDIDTIISNLATVIIALVTTVVLMLRIVSWDLSVNHSIYQTIFLIISIVIVVIACSVISCHMSGKRFDVDYDVFQKGAKYNRYGDFYTMEYLTDEDAAMDIRIYQQEDLILSECQSQCYDYFAEGKRKEMNAVSCYSGINICCSCICGCVIYALIGTKAIQGAIGAGSILLMYTTVTLIINALSAIAEIITDLRNNNEHLIHFFQYMDIKEETESVVHMEQNERLSKIEFSNVSFQYPESNLWVLQNINLKINCGEKLAIVGENGSGKTTLIKLLCRLYRPTEGKITLNGKDIWDYPYDEYINRIATVFQDFSLFAFPLANNIAASDVYERERVVAALNQAGLSDRVQRMEKGIEQPLFHDFDEEGTDLSGGEAQKVAIARAVYKDADIMVLDEPTAALDPYAESEIYMKFHEITKDKTVISISHRLSSCRVCDRIIVMDHGLIIQDGSHGHLIQDREKKYYEMWNAQAQYYI